MPPKSSEPSTKTEDKTDAPKIGRKTLALILGHLEKREEKNDEIVQKQNKQWWTIALLLVVGLLASIGVAGVVKMAGIEANFTPATTTEPK